MAARSSLLRRPTPGARPARRTSSVVAALAALAPRLVRLARHHYPDGLLGGVLGVEAHVGDRQVGGEDAPLAAPERQAEHDRELARPHAPPRPRHPPRE